MIEKTDIGDLKGIGEKTKKLFEKINIHTVGDLIRYYPHGYDVYEEGVKNGYFCTNQDGTPFVAGVWPGRVHFPDMLNPEARAWFGSQYKVLRTISSTAAGS